jgi:hypothetical protein
MGEARNGGLRVPLDGKVKLEFHGARVSSDGGLLAYRELDEALGLTARNDDQRRTGEMAKGEGLCFRRKTPIAQ